MYNLFRIIKLFIIYFNINRTNTLPVKKSIFRDAEPTLSRSANQMPNPQFARKQEMKTNTHPPNIFT